MTKVRFHVLNALADDWENVEQIYKSVAFEFVGTESDATGRVSYLFRQSPGADLLADVVGELTSLLGDEMVEYRREDSPEIVTGTMRDYSILRAWFRPTPKGRRAWADAVDQDRK